MKQLAEILNPAICKDDCIWLEENAPEIYRAVEAAVIDGHSPREIYLHYMQMSPNRQALWLRVKHAAEWLEGQGE